MKKYITRDKLADFISRMWDAGINVDIEPANKQIVIKKTDGRYEWIPVYDKTSYEELIDSLISLANDVDEQ